MIRKTAGQLNITKQRQPQDLGHMILRLSFLYIFSILGSQSAVSGQTAEASCENLS